MKNPFKKSFAVSFSKPADKKIKILYTRRPVPGIKLFFIRLDGSDPVCYVKPNTETNEAVIYQILPGKGGAALFTVKQLDQFFKDFDSNGLVSEEYKPDNV